VEFILSKLADKTLGNALDDRRRTGRALFDFYDSLTELEELTTEFASILERAASHPTGRIFSAWLVGFQFRVNEASSRFRTHMNTLLRVIALYDPSLERLLSSVNVGKKSIRLQASQFFHTADNSFFTDWKLERERGLSSLTILVSKNDSSLNLDETYEDLPTSHDGSWRDRTDYLDEATRKLTTTLDLAPDDTGTIRSLGYALTDHIRLLETAREDLRLFITSRFSLDELLYVRPRRKGKAT
jgi:hypothetical protein